MKHKILAALVLGCLTSGFAHAVACIVIGPGAPLDPPSGPTPAVPTTFALAPLLLGSNPGLTSLMENLVVEAPALLATGGNTPPPRPPSGGGGGCSSTRNLIGPGDLNQTSYIEQRPYATGVYRHQIQFDLSGYLGNSDPRTEARAWWPVLAWELPSEASGPEVVDILRIDYSGRHSGLPTPLADAYFNVYRGDGLITTVLVKTAAPNVELIWSDTGQMLLLLDVGENAGAEIVQIPLAGFSTKNIQPISFQVGRVAMPASIRGALGTIEAASYLIEAPPAPINAENATRSR